MKQTCYNVDNSDDAYSEVGNREASAADRDTTLNSTVTDIVSLAYTFTHGKGKGCVFIEPLAEYLFKFPQFL